VDLKKGYMIAGQMALVRVTTLLQLSPLLLPISLAEYGIYTRVGSIVAYELQHEASVTTEFDSNSIFTPSYPTLQILLKNTCIMTTLPL